MAAHDDVRAFEYARFHHYGFRFGRHHFFAGTAVNRDSSRSARAGEKLRDGHSSSHPYRALRAVLVAMKGALGAAQRVVLEKDAEIGARGAALVFGDKSGGQASYRYSDFKIVGLKIGREFCDRLRFLKADLRMLRNPVAHGQKLGLHQLLYARENFVASLILRGELRHPCRDTEGLA